MLLSLQMSPFLFILLFALANANLKEIEISSEDTTSPTTTTKKIPKSPRTADELGVPRCSSNYDCVHSGVCHTDVHGYGRCVCQRSCPSYVPVSCHSKQRQRTRPPADCLTMGVGYASKYNISEPKCYQNKCMCPPMFELDEKPSGPVKNLLPYKCDKRELSVVGAADPSDSVYKGADVTLYCCINVDPHAFVDAAGVMFVQNTTVIREATSHPFKEDLDEYSALSAPPCWALEIKNVQLSDSGSYMCLVNSTGKPVISVNYTINFVVKAPRMIQSLVVQASSTAANVSWDVQQGPQLKIDMRLLRRTDLNGREVWKRENAVSPLTIPNLRPALPYTLFVTVRDGQTEPFEITEHFTTAESRPYPPKTEDVRVMNSGSSLICEVEWRAPSITNGRITKYYVRVRGGIRRPRPDGSLVSDDFPQATDTDKCANWDESEESSQSINPIDFSTEFMSCKYGPLKPNRNYTVTLWAENSAGRSQALSFNKTCVTDYAQPDTIEQPTTSSASNHSAFNVHFAHEPDDTNGPISCYYIAIVPLMTNVSLDSLPLPSDIVIDSLAKTFNNNMLQAQRTSPRYFAYIAESYASFVRETVIGDGVGVEGMKPCNVLYLSRHKAEDSALRPGLKYTGFLIVRVDKDESIREEPRPLRDRYSRRNRQLHLSGPAYGFSGYFKPVYLKPDDESDGALTALKIAIPLILFLVIAAAVAIFFLMRRGMLSKWFPLSLSKNNDRALLHSKIYTAVPVDDLPEEYVIRQRDSYFLFEKEYDALPTYNLESTASARKENAPKNRYNDIQAYDATRVKLKKIDGIDHSDYINANFIRGYDDKKQFIAAQAPVEHTLADFWRMIWEQESYLIVMVANLTEKGRSQCTKYWPDSQEAIRYGKIEVSLQSTDYLADYTVRSFDVTNLSLVGSKSMTDSIAGSEYANVPSGRVSTNGRIETSFCGTGNGAVRRILQYHFTNWNDYKAPECCTGLLRFVDRLRTLEQYNSHPIVIHCSAGVGRTGTFITIDSMLDQCEAEGKVDIFSFVSGLRKQRNLMVQSMEQYVFIYKALAEWHLFGTTDKSVHELVEHYRTLPDPLPKEYQSSSTGVTHVSVRPERQPQPASAMEAEYRRLERSVEPTPKISFATKEENMSKNRVDGAYPYDRNRVVLSPTLGYSDTSYINASTVKGYFYPYILAQDPVGESTVFDFWRMITECNVTSVVMLSHESEWQDYEKYWPMVANSPLSLEGSGQKITVELMSEECHSNFVQRKINYQRKIQNDLVHQTVMQFSLSCWPKECVVPTSSEPVLSLIGRVLERQSTLPDSGPIVLHCRDGSSATGVFCAISLLLERLKAEQRIDVFQTVRGLQLQRPLMFTKLEHYAYCYQAVIDYIRTSLR